jgi:RNA polymerase sigma-70 factor (ECF subfamily)
MNDRRVEEGQLGPLLESYRNRLRRMVEVRMHPRLKNRVDASDVLQEAFLEVSCRLSEYQARPEAPFFLWVRRITGDKLSDLHRHHLGAQKRDAQREGLGTGPEVNTISLSKLLLDTGPSPSEAQSRNEELERFRATLDRMDEGPREALTLRHFEHATNQEVAQILGVSNATASRYYMRALQGVRSFLKRDGHRE